MASGCFYFGDLHITATNDPPAISPSPLDGTTVLIPTSGVTVNVVARDPEGSGVTFEWRLEGGGHVNAESFDADSKYVSQVTFAWDEDLDQRTLECLVYDDSAEPVVLQWYLEVP